MGDDDSAQRFGLSVLGLLSSQLGGLSAQSTRFLRRGMLAQHAETLEMMAKVCPATCCWSVLLPARQPARPQLAATDFASCCFQLRKQMRENAAKYGVDVPPQALEPDEPTDATSHTAAAATLTARNFATVDGFLGEAGAGALRAEVLQMVADGLLKPGLLEVYTRQHYCHRPFSVHF